MKKHLLKGLILLLCLLVMSAAHAEDSFTINVDGLDLGRLNSDDYVSRHLSSSAQGVRVRKYISDSSELAAPIRLTITQMDSRTLVLDKNYGFQSGTFDSGVLFLPYGGDGTTPYLITLYVGDYVYAMPFMQLQRRLHSNSACTVGPRLRDLDSSMGSDWLMGTVLDLNRLRSKGSQTVDVCASNSCLIGTAQVSMQGSSLRVDLSFRSSANVDVLEEPVYVITDGGSIHSARAHGTGEWIDVGSAQSALLYLPLKLSYDPAGLPSFHYRSSDYSDQFDRWDDCRARDSGGTDWSADTWEADTWQPSPDWNGGWADGDYGWGDDWSSEADGWA